MQHVNLTIVEVLLENFKIVSRKYHQSLHWHCSEEQIGGISVPLKVFLLRKLESTSNMFVILK